MLGALFFLLVLAQGEPTTVLGEAQEPLLNTNVTGYFDSRLTFAELLPHRLLPADDVPRFVSRNEGNFQLKLRWGEQVSAMADASFYYQLAKGFAGIDPSTGKHTSLPDHDVPAYRPLALVNELYVSANPLEDLNITLGKKRVVWGPGFAANPMDILNPPKDPTDPTNQRTGAYLVRVEAPFETMTLTALAAAQVLRQYGGVPAALLYYPDYPSREAKLAPEVFPDTRDQGAHYLAAARLYALLWDTDVNVAYFFSNRYNDAFTNKSRIGLSLSRYFFESLELHLEAVGQQGSARAYYNPACVGDFTTAAACLVTQTGGSLDAGALANAGATLLRGTATKIDDERWVTHAVLGSRYSFDDESMASLEYLYYSDGFNDSQFRAFAQAMRLGRDLRRSSLPASLPGDLGTRLLARAGSGGADPGSPQNFSFDPLRRHYLVASYMKPRIADDFTLNVVLVVGLHELAGQFAPSLSWSAAEWLTLGASAFVPLPGLESKKTVVQGQHYSEYDIVPLGFRTILTARAYY